MTRSPYRAVACTQGKNHEEPNSPHPHCSSNHYGTSLHQVVPHRGGDAEATSQVTIRIGDDSHPTSPRDGLLGNSTNSSWRQMTF